MARYILHWLGGKTQSVEGGDIADACRRAGIGNGDLPALDYYEEEGSKTQVAGIANCGCVHHAEDGTSCEHDLQSVGLREKAYDYPVFGTQGGGLVREVSQGPFIFYVFVEKPNHSGLDVGDTMPKDWDIIPLNQAACDLVGHQQWMDSD